MSPQRPHPADAGPGHNYDKNAKHSTAITAPTTFRGRDHYTCGEPGWEAVADFALEWALAPRAGVLDHATGEPR